MKFYQYFLKLSVFLLLVVSSTIFANPAISDIRTVFNVQSANQTLTKLNQQFSLPDLSIEDLASSLNTLIRLQTHAKECVKRAQTNLSEVEALHKEVFPEEVTSTEPLTETQQYLQTKKSEFSDRVLACRLFVLQSQELITKTNLRIQALSAKQLFRIETPFLEKVAASRHLLSDMWKKFDVNLLIEKSGIQSFMKTFPLTIFLIALFVTMLASLFLSRIVYRKKMTCNPDDFSCRFSYAFICTVRKYIFWFAGIFILFVVTNALDLVMQQPTTLAFLSTVLLVYISFLIFIYFFFYPFFPERTISGVSLLAKPLLFRLQLLAGLSLVSALIYIILQDQPLIPSMISFIRSVFVTLIAISLIHTLWLVNRIKILQKRRVLCLTISVILTVLLSLILIVEWLGYQQFVDYILEGIFLTMVFSFLAIVVHRIIKTVLKSSAGIRSIWVENLHTYLGLGRKESLLELAVLRMIFYLLIWFFFLVILLKIWGSPEAHFRILRNVLLDGFSIAGLKIVPIKILFAALFFIFSFLFIRWIKTAFERSKDLQMNRGVRSAVAALITYIGVIIVLMFTLVIAGVKLAGLAVVAGALSVGIGFGLKDVVNNFISGLILLVERPIKVGDRVIINNIEGFVKRIHIRSTRIRTLEYSDLIVPNAEIISGQLINLSGWYSKVPIVVQVAGDNDPEFVKQILLEVANAHPKVITDIPEHNPAVFFTELGKEGLKCELYCTVPDVSVKYNTLSELYSEISKAFKENGIDIALIRQDVHIKNWSALETVSSK